MHFNIRLEEDRLCCLVIVGVRPDGTKELVALADGYRESTDSWAEVLRSLRYWASRPRCSPSATERSDSGEHCVKVFPQTREQRCWVHRTANVLDALPKRLHAEAKDAVRNIYGAPSCTEALDAVKVFTETYADFKKATDKITGELDTLLAFFDFPVEHWVHLRTTNPIESTFSTVRLRTKVTRGAGSRQAGLAMAYKLLDSAQDRWRRIGGAELVPLVRARATFIDGQLQERSDNKAESATDTDTKKGSVAA